MLASVSPCNVCFFFFQLHTVYAATWFSCRFDHPPPPSYPTLSPLPPFAFVPPLLPSFCQPWIFATYFNAPFPPNNDPPSSCPCSRPPPPALLGASSSPNASSSSDKCALPRAWTSSRVHIMSMQVQRHVLHARSRIDPSALGVACAALHSVARACSRLVRQLRGIRMTFPFDVHITNQRQPQ
jgi:hypothetical protein